MNSFVTLDQAMILLYLLGILGLGFFKRSKRDEKTFLFAGRKLTIPAFVATLVATWYGGILEIGRFSFENGIVTWLIFGFSYYIAAILFSKSIGWGSASRGGCGCTPGCRPSAAAAAILLPDSIENSKKCQRAAAAG